MIGLQHPAGAEHPGRAVGQADHAGGDRGELVGAVRRQVPRRGEEQPVGRDGHHVRDPRHAVGEVAEQPAHVLHGGGPGHRFVSFVDGRAVLLTAGRTAALHTAVIRGQQSPYLVRGATALVRWPCLFSHAARHELCLRHPLGQAGPGGAGRGRLGRPAWPGANPRRRPSARPRLPGRGSRSRRFRCPDWRGLLLRRRRSASIRPPWSDPGCGPAVWPGPERRRSPPGWRAGRPARLPGAPVRSAPEASGSPPVGC